MEVPLLKRHWFLPATPDVLALLRQQSELTVAGMKALVRWSEGDAGAEAAVRRAEHEADAARRELLTALRAAFTTPMDAEDLYTLSERLDEVLNAAKNVVREAELIGVVPDAVCAEMSRLALAATEHLGEAFAKLKSDSDAATAAADGATKEARRIEHSYRAAMADLADEQDLRTRFARHEIYRLYLEMSTLIVRVSHRTWYAVMKEA